MARRLAGSANSSSLEALPFCDIHLDEPAFVHRQLDTAKAQPFQCLADQVNGLSGGMVCACRLIVAHICLRRFGLWGLVKHYYFDRQYMCGEVFLFCAQVLRACAGANAGLLKRLAQPKVAYEPAQFL